MSERESSPDKKHHCAEGILVSVGSKEHKIFSLT